jgi:O-antigen/teichoic acid export membrane protein
MGNFVVLVLTMRLYGPVAAGVLFNVLAIGYTAAIVANIGLSRFTLRMLPRESNDLDRTADLIGQIQFLIIGMVVGLGSIGVISSFILMSHLITYSEQTQLWLEGAALGLLLGASLLFLMGTADVLKAQGHVGMAILVEVSAFPWLSVLGLGIGYLAGTSTVLLPGFVTVGSAALVSSVVLWRLPNVTWHPVTRAPAGQLTRAKNFLYSHWRVLAVYWTSGSLVMVSSRMTGLVAPIFLLPAEAGFVAALVGIASLGGTIIAAAQAYFAPRFSILHGAQNTSALSAELRLSQIIVGGIFSLIAIPVMFFPANTLSLFGSEAAAFPTNLLIFATAAQLLRCFTGCSEVFLTMTSKSGFETVTLILAIIIFWMALVFGGGADLDRFVYAYCAMLATRGMFSYVVAIYELRRDQLK